MTAPTVSVVVVSHGRPDALCLALTGIGQLDYPSFEIVVVADQDGIKAVGRHPLAGQIKIVQFDTANISSARNAGIAVAGGQIIAFIDDDAVPEPTWLTHLIAPFSDLRVGAAGGYVIGRNGISFQWKGRTIDQHAQARDLPIQGDSPQVFANTPRSVIKTEGTNMAVRRDVLVALGGFDPAFEFYLDETDLNMRIGQAGHHTAIVPLAQVHHGYAGSSRRREDRVPTDLTQIGASLAVYLTKHSGDLGQHKSLRDEQRRRLIRHMVSGAILPSDVARILASFDRGWADGLSRAFGAMRDFGIAPPFRSVQPTRHGPMQVLSGFDDQHLMTAANSGHRTTVFQFSRTALFHRVQFTPEGFWLHKGGLFGKSDRRGRLVQPWRVGSRVTSELQRIKEVRGVG